MRIRTGLLLFGIVLTGCDAPGADESLAAPPRVVSGSGVIRGTVKFTGAVPELKTSQVKCHEGTIDVSDESVVVNDTGTLRNAFVYLEGAAATGDGSSREAALLDQVDCRYVPHAIGVQAGQTLRVRSSDPTLHNVHAIPKANDEFNFGQQPSTPPMTRMFETPEIGVTFRCDVHGWMRAYANVVTHPFYAVTKEDGNFEIKGLPAGTYTIEAWHERLGTQTQQVTIADGSPNVTAAFTFKPAA